MKIQDFNHMCDLFDELIDNSYLEYNMSVIDGESILSRVYKKINGRIENKILSYLLVYKIHILNEEYESAKEVKHLIINKF